MSTVQPIAFRRPDPAILIRPVTLRDLDTLMLRCWPGAPRATLHRLILRARDMAEQRSGGGVVACDDHGPYAYGQLTAWPRCGEISDLVVCEQLRRRGAGTAIIQYLAHLARELHVACLEIGAAADNPRAAALYRRLGFRDSYTLRLTLSRGEVDVVYMRLDLPPEMTTAGGQGASEMLR